MGPVDTSSSGLSRVAAVMDDAAAILAGRTVAVLTGAGISTDSGIPDYRGPDAVPHTPMTISDFLSGPTARQRYWARSHLGWRRIRDARPNAGHRALSAMQASGAVATIITQNVDGLHERAGASTVIDLHGRLDTVVCLSCGTLSAREELDRRLAALNPGFAKGVISGDLRPDGDVEVGDTTAFTVAACAVCGGILKPDVVFFGENVPPDRVRASYDAVSAAQALLVAGSSLAVMSGLRFVKSAVKQSIPVVIVNRGATRGDEYAAVRIDAGCSETLTALQERLS